MSSFRITAQVQPYVDALGLDIAVEFLLAFGGTEVYLSTRPQERSQVAELVGAEAAIKLAQRIGSGPCRVHTAKPFLAAYFRYKRKWSVVQIARKLHVTDVTVRNWLGPAPQNQLSFSFGD
jgi:hypothetical protein